MANPSLGLTKIVEEWRKNLCGPVWKCGGFIAVRCQNRSGNGLEARVWAGIYPRLKSEKIYIC
ncbi:hypothetical protein [Microcoleus sp. PH2017_05_CCC_O_A]|uniref:hypothetical protein n=1 Tax=Microcoleus sp. PH2017_05_CCC_O_A TaxID=2798816 RepID=UPI0025EC9887|nr:hypothetical protein [Microcoleus sp. PH2017_05_CCC_O_A]